MPQSTTCRWNEGKKWEQNACWFPSSPLSLSSVASQEKDQPLFLRGISLSLTPISGNFTVLQIDRNDADVVGWVPINRIHPCSIRPVSPIRADPDPQLVSGSFDGFIGSWVALALKRQGANHRNTATTAPPRLRARGGATAGGNTMTRGRCCMREEWASGIWRR